MIRSLTSFRFITAFAVFLFHCRIHFDWRLGSNLIDKFVLNGATFMTGFFVLSGFIMSHVYGEMNFSARSNIYNYYLKRFAKIYPTYAVSTIFYFTLFGRYDFRQLGRILGNDLFLVQGFFQSMFPIGINGGTWSLTVEVFLYFLFPLLLFISNRSWKILFAALIIAAIVSFNVYLDPSDYAYANPVFRICDFMCGMGFYSIRQKLKNVKFAGLLHLAFVAALIWACRNLGGDKAQYMQGQFVVVPLFGAWIVMVFHSNSKFYNNRILEYLGLISYSFYLWQFVAMEVGEKILRFHPDFNRHALVLLAFSINVAVSSLSYHLLEERVRRWLTARFIVRVQI